jgi:GNAT superfamily N-acetyltransferase
VPYRKESEVVEPEPIARRATASDLERLTSIISQAFANDPLWGRALQRADGSTDHHAKFWRLLVAGALRHPWTWLLDGDRAAALWIPPNQTELDPDQEARLVQLARDDLGPGTEDYLDLLGRFEAAHPHDEPHYYLSLLATHSDHRGQGLGMWLLADNLEQIDAEHCPAYLESSNPANDHRYARLGFEPVAEIVFPRDDVHVTTMWRAAR